MVKRKPKFDKAGERAAKIIQAQLDTLTSDAAKARREQLHRKAVKASRAAKGGKR